LKVWNIVDNDMSEEIKEFGTEGYDINGIDKKANMYLVV